MTDFAVPLFYAHTFSLYRLCSADAGPSYSAGTTASIASRQAHNQLASNVNLTICQLSKESNNLAKSWLGVLLPSSQEHA